MSRFRKLSHSIWHCQYHIVWVPRYRYRILVGAAKEAAEVGIQAICGYAGCEVVELNVQSNHVHMVVMIPPKVSVSELCGRLKGQTAMKLFHQFRQLKKKPYWGNHFWAKGYCLDTVGSDDVWLGGIERAAVAEAKNMKEMKVMRDTKSMKNIVKKENRSHETSKKTFKAILAILLVGVVISISSWAFAQGGSISGSLMINQTTRVLTESSSREKM